MAAHIPSMETRYKDEIVVDNYLRARFTQDTQLTGGIEPSRDFVQRTIRSIKAYDRRRQAIQDGVVIVLTMSPVILRQAWLWFRQDYFSVSSLPFGQTIIHLYGFFLSAIMLYGLVALGFVLLTSYAFKFRREYAVPMRQIISW